MKSIRQAWQRSRARPVDVMNEAKRGKPQGVTGGYDYVYFPDRQPNVFGFYYEALF